MANAERSGRRPCRARAGIANRHAALLFQPATIKPRRVSGRSTTAVNKQHEIAFMMEKKQTEQSIFSQKVWTAGGILALIVILLLLLQATFNVWLLVLAAVLIAV